jgi:hypothetical protein
VCREVLGSASLKPTHQGPIRRSNATAIALAALPEEIKGFGHVKQANYPMAKVREAALLAELRLPARSRSRRSEAGCQLDRASAF